MASPTKAAFLQVHSLIGLAISVVLGLIGLTGAMLGFEDEIVAALNRDAARVEVRPVPVLSPDALIAVMQAAPGSAKVSGLTLSSAPGATVRVRFARGEGDDRASVYVDPYDGRVLAPMHGEGFFVTLRALHRWLLLPDGGKGIGRQVTGVAVLGLLILLVSGLVLRWPRRMRSLRAWLKPNLATPGRPFHWSLHSVVGTWVLPVYLVSILSGLWWSFDWYRDGATWLLSSKPAAGVAMPRAAKGSPKAAAAADGPAMPSIDKVWATFLADQGSRYAVANLQLPNGAGTAVRVRSVATDAPFEEARDEFRIDSVTGRMISAERYIDKGSGDRFLAAVLHIHTGAFLGLPGRILFMLAAATMPLFMVTGFILYLSRRRLRAGSKTSRRRPVELVPGE